MTTATLTECSGQGAAMGDRVSFAVTHAGTGGKVYVLERRLTLAQPVPAQALMSKLSETMPSLTADPDMTISSSAACDRILTGNDPALTAGTVRVYASGAAGGFEQFTPFATNCRAAFSMRVEGSGGLAQALSIVLFDGRPFSSLLRAGVGAPPAPDAALLPAELKF